MTATLNVELPEKLEFLLHPKRYKVAYGGRASGAKSWSFIRAAIVRALASKTRILCAREIQKSIKESIHHLIVDQIEMMGVSDCFVITDNSIKVPGNGSEFFFEGLFRNVNRIKSIEGIDIAFVEEAEGVGEESWEYLIPTIRKQDSEIWVVFNPAYEDDATYKRFVTNPPSDCISVYLTPDDNPWFPDVLKKEMEHDKAHNEQRYRHIWLGEPVGSGAKIWYNYDQKVHVKDYSMQEIREKGNCYMSIDPHSKYYPAAIWLAKIPRDANKREFFYVVYNEWPTFELLGGYYSDLRKTLYYNDTLERMAKSLYMMDGTAEYGIKIMDRYIDTRFAKGAGGSSWSTQTTGVQQEFAKHGLIFNLPPERVIDVQRDVIIEAMDYNKLIDITKFNSPSLIVMPHCKNVRHSLLNHRCEEGSEKEDDKYKDFSDALRICFAGIADEKYKDPSVESSKISTFYQPSFRSQNTQQSWMG